MIRDIVKDPLFLSRPSVDATIMDHQVIVDLKDTLEANKAGCVGMAANMIGVSKKIIIADNMGLPMIMVNPVILEKTGPYETEEGCLSLSGVRKTTRYKSIKVHFLNEAFQKRIKTFDGWTAQIIQHEIDHLSGILI